MRVGSLQRQRKSSILPVIGGCLAVYAVCAVGFHALVEPSLGKNQPPPPPVLQYSAAALAARAEAVPVSPVAAGRPAAAAPATPKAGTKTAAKVAPVATPAIPPAVAVAPAPTATTAPTPAVVPTPAVALAPAAAPAADLAPAVAPTTALTPAATPLVAADATADTAEKPATVEAPKKPARKRVAAPKPQPGFFDFFSGGFNNNNARASNTRSRSAQSNGGFRPFF
ncbi:MAG: hypothetical protein ABWZ93_15140 [Xanthobacteraceae bacterium]